MRLRVGSIGRVVDIVTHTAQNGMKENLLWSLG